MTEADKTEEEHLISTEEASKNELLEKDKLVDEEKKISGKKIRKRNRIKNLTKNDLCDKNLIFLCWASSIATNSTTSEEIESDEEKNWAEDEPHIYQLKKSVWAQSSQRL